MKLMRFLFVALISLTNVYSFGEPAGTIKWSFDIQGTINDPVAIGKDGTIYAASQDQHIWAINPNGTKKWAAPIIYNPMGTPLIHSNGYIYFAANDNQLGIHSFGAITDFGYILFQINLPNYNLTNYIAPTENVDGSLLIASLIQQNSSTTIHSLWNYSSNSGSFLNNTSFSKTNDFSNNYLYKPFVDQSNGRISIAGLESSEPASKIFIMNAGKILGVIVNPTSDHTHQYSPIGGNNRGIIYFGDTLGNLAAYSDIDFSEIWIAPLGGDLSHARPILDTKGNIYVGSSNGYLYNVAPDGTINWSIAIDKAGISKDVALDSQGTIYITTNNGNLYALDSSGKVKWVQRAIANTAPKIGPDGTIYVGSLINSVIAIFA